MNILVVMNDPKLFKTVEPFLAADKMKTVYATTLADAISKIQANKFDVILFSWNLNMVDVRKTYEFLDSKLSSMIVVFSELDKPQIVKQLMASRINRTMFPPLSGPGVIKRIQQLLRLRAGDGVGVPHDLGIVAVAGTDVPSDITWEAAQAPGQTPGGDKFWQGVSSKDESSTFVYQGTEAPKWDAAKKSWQAPGNVYLKVSQDARGAMGNLLGQPIKKKAKVTVLGGDKEVAKKYQMPETNEADGSALFYASLSAALEIVAAVFCDPNEIDDEMDQVTVSWVQSGQMTGMIVVGDNHEKKESLNVLHELQHGVKNESETKKEKYELLINKAVVPIPSTNVTKWADRKTKYVYGVKSPTSKMVMAYVPVEKKIEFALDESGQYYAVSVEEALRNGVKVPCDFFVFMKKNQRFVRYIAKDSTVNDSVISKLTNNQITNVMFHKNDLDAFLQYKSKYYLGLTK